MAARSAPTRSILLAKAIRGTRYRSAWRQTVSLCGSTPLTASKTAMAPSRTRRLRSTSSASCSSRSSGAHPASLSAHSRRSPSTYRLAVVRAIVFVLLAAYTLYATPWAFLTLDAFKAEVDAVHICPPVAEIPACTIAAAQAGAETAL